MGRIKKKGEEGTATEYMSRSRAVRKLQLSLADFRRLCILKGIYPREPPNKKKVTGSTANRTYYFVKDINWLLHEPLLQRFRELKTYARRLKKAEAKDQPGVVKAIRRREPKVKVNHLVKERYPSFVDAIRDLDDCLCMLFLFASFPQTGVIRARMVEKCRRLCNEFMLYVVRARALRKVFLSIKGIYYQAEIMGQTVTWIAPYQFATDVPTDVDFRVMGTFLQFYLTLLGFVNFKLYATLGMHYPPQRDALKDSAGLGLSALKMQTEQEFEAAQSEASETMSKHHRKQAKKTESRVAQALADVKAAMDEDLNDEEEELDAQTKQEAAPADRDQASFDTFEAMADPAVDSDMNVPSGQDLEEAAAEADAATRIFQNLYFFLSREVPRYSLEFVIRSFGGNVSWDALDEAEAGPYGVDDPRITHHIVDRPAVSQTFDGRHYVQPQWVYDCINAKALLPTSTYTLGAVLPPHLSPFVEEGADDYMPPERRAQLAAAKNIHSTDMTIDESEAPEEIDDEDIYRKELEAELRGDDTAEAPEEPKGNTAKRKKTKAEKGKAAEEERKEMAKLMMSKRDRTLYNRIVHSKKQKQVEAQKLTARRQQIDKEKSAKKSKK